MIVIGIHGLKTHISPFFLSKGFSNNNSTCFIHQWSIGWVLGPVSGKPKRVKAGGGVQPFHSWQVWGPYRLLVAMGRFSHMFVWLALGQMGELYESCADCCFFFLCFFFFFFEDLRYLGIQENIRLSWGMKSEPTLYISGFWCHGNPILNLFLSIAVEGQMLTDLKGNISDQR